MPRFPSNPWGFFGFLSEHGEEERLKVVGHHPYSTHPTKTKSKKAREKDPNTSNTFKHCILSCLHLSSVSLPSHFRLTSPSSQTCCWALPMLSAILCWASHHLLKFVACHPLFQTPLHFCIVTSIHLTPRFSFQPHALSCVCFTWYPELSKYLTQCCQNLYLPTFMDIYQHLHHVFTSCIYIMYIMYHNAANVSSALLICLLFNKFFFKGLVRRAFRA